MGKPVDMKRTSKEVKAIEKRNDGPYEPPAYPRGLDLHLGTDEMQKLGLKSLPTIGTEFKIMGTARVTGGSIGDRYGMGPSDDSDGSMSLDLQITELGCETVDKQPDAKTLRDELYAAAGKDA